MDTANVNNITSLGSQLFLSTSSLDKDNLVESILYYQTTHTHTLYLYFGLAILVLLFASQMRMIIINGITNRKIAKQQGERPRDINSSSSRNVLILGDSTGYGTGARTIEDTLAGRFAHDFPDVAIHNYAVNGSTTSNMLTQLKRAEGKHYNLTIISSGGNDTWKMTPLASVEQNLREVISRTMTLSGKNIVLIIYNNDISAPVFPFFIRWLITRRTRIINEIYLRTAEIYGIQAVPVFLPGETCPSNFFSHDGLHPSSEGYRIMYIRLWAALYQHRFDYNLREY